MPGSIDVPGNKEAFVLWMVEALNKETCLEAKMYNINFSVLISLQSHRKADARGTRKSCFVCRFCIRF